VCYKSASKWQPLRAVFFVLIAPSANQITTSFAPSPEKSHALRICALKGREGSLECPNKIVSDGTIKKTATSLIMVN